MLKEEMSAIGKVLCIIAHEGYQPIEYHEPKKIIQEAGFAVITASDKSGKATDKEGGTTHVDILLSDAHSSDYDAIVFIGGPGALEHLDNQESYRIIKDAYEKHIVIGAICVATRILAKAQVLSGKRATGWNGDNQLEKIYQTYNAIYLPEPVVVEDAIITAVGPSATRTFGQEIVAALQSNRGWG